MFFKTRTYVLCINIIPSPYSTLCGGLVHFSSSPLLAFVCPRLHHCFLPFSSIMNLFFFLLSPVILLPYLINFPTSSSVDLLVYPNMISTSSSFLHLTILLISHECFPFSLTVFLRYTVFRWVHNHMFIAGLATIKHLLLRTCVRGNS